MTARELFLNAYMLAGRIEELTRIINDGGLVDMPRGSGNPNAISDPTFSAALGTINCEQRVTDARRERSDIERELGEALRIIDGVRAGLGDNYAKCLDLHFVNRWTWAAVASELGVTSRTCILWTDAAFGWIDTVGFAHAKDGSGIAT